ncbi:MAG TPA: hypothetical protein VFK23_09160, partial [Nitrospirota bacterium]|nr:hypothetical protein [Nitrospirota bacterium]
ASLYNFINLLYLWQERDNLFLIVRYPTPIFLNEIGRKKAQDAQNAGQHFYPFVPLLRIFAAIIMSSVFYLRRRPRHDQRPQRKNRCSERA